MSFVSQVENNLWIRIKKYAHVTTPGDNLWYIDNFVTKKIFDLFSPLAHLFYESFSAASPLKFWDE